MPGASGLVLQMIQPERKTRMHQIGFAIEKERYAFGVLGIKDEVVRLLSFDP
jgi:hypothetical protein